ncbi:MAG: biotin--[acetyl-CoA-carboxylase] ligase [Rhodospirillaceae bacterium]
MTFVSELPTGWRLTKVSETESTNSDMRKLAEAGESEGLLLLAKTQTSGRGRRGRVWSSPTGNLYVSILVDAPPPTAGEVGFVAALSLIDAVELTAGREVPALRCKWPNDVLYRGGKAAGLLLEAVPERSQVIVGIGVNLIETVVEDALYPIGSLSDLSIAPEDLAVSLAQCLSKWLETLRTLGFAPVRRAWLNRATGVGENVVVRLPQDTFEGTFKGLAEDGALLLDQGMSGVKAVSAGDVFFRAGA